MMEIKEMKKLIDGEVTYVTYEIGGYNVECIKRDVIENIYVSKKNFNEEYLPDIIFESGFLNNNRKEFKIQTTSYGALNTEAINKMIEKLNEAQAVVNELTKFFLN